jgi:hypothetical protein
VRRANRKIDRRKKAKAVLTELLNRPDQVVVIHYSCESFYDRPDGSSPRITSIAVRNLESGQANSFSIHQMGEIKGYSADEIEENYNELEKMMLDDFYSYLDNHRSKTWLHWNMRNSDYGFQALAHRYRVLGGDPPEISEAQLANLSSLLVDIYGSNYIGHQKLPNITKKNNISDIDFLSGADEAVAFENKEYVKLHRSTLRKVEILAKLAQLTEEGFLKTNARWKDLYGLHPIAIGEYIKDSWFFSILGFIAAIASIVGLILYLIDKILEYG